MYLTTNYCIPEKSCTTLLADFMEVIMTLYITSPNVRRSNKCELNPHNSINDV